MTTFQDRERAEEAKFAHDEEMAFRIHARRNRLLGTWAAERMGLLPAEAESYAKAVVQADFEEAGDEDVVRKILGDLISAGVEADEAEVRLAMKAKEAEPAARCWAPTDPFQPELPPMPMPADQIEALIRAAIPDAEVTITDLAGDGDHYAAHVVSPVLPGGRALPSTRRCLPRLAGAWGRIARLATHHRHARLILCGAAPIDAAAFHPHNRPFPEAVSKGRFPCPTPPIRRPASPTSSTATTSCCS
jgi:stress-induced morphogen